MQDYASLIRHEGNRQLFEAVEMSIIAQLWGEPLHLHAEGVRGTGKTTILRAARRILPRIERIRGCPYNCDPQAPHCPLHAHWTADQIAAHGTEWIPMPFREISPSAKVGTVTGSLDLGRLTDAARPEAALLPGTLAQAHRGIVLVDEINRLADVAPELADCLLDVMGTKPGRLQIEETGLPPVEIPVRVAVWAASNPDEEPGPLEEIRRQLSDRFDLVLDVRRPGEPWLVKRILLLGEARTRAAADAARAALAGRGAGGAEAGGPGGEQGEVPGGALTGDPAGAVFARPAGNRPAGREEPVPGRAVAASASMAERGGITAGRSRGGGEASAGGSPGDGRVRPVGSGSATGRETPGGRDRSGEGQDRLPAVDRAGEGKGDGGPGVAAAAVRAVPVAGDDGATTSAGREDEWNRRWRDAAAGRPEFPEALLELLAEIYVQFRLESLRALEAWRHGAALYAARAGRRRVLRADILEIGPAVLRHRVEAGVLSEILEYLAREDDGPDGRDHRDAGPWSGGRDGDASVPTGSLGNAHGAHDRQAVPGGGAVARAEAGDGGWPGAGSRGYPADGLTARAGTAGADGGDTGPGGVWSRLRGMLSRAAGHGAGGPGGPATAAAEGARAGSAVAGRAWAGAGPAAPGGGTRGNAPGSGVGPYGSMPWATHDGSAHPADGPGAGPVRPGAREGTTPPYPARPLLELTRDRAIRSWGHP